MLGEKVPQILKTLPEKVFTVLVQVEKSPVIR
jgi:hypothetical protein